MEGFNFGLKQKGARILAPFLYFLPFYSDDSVVLFVAF